MLLCFVPQFVTGIHTKRNLSNCSGWHTGGGEGVFSMWCHMKLCFTSSDCENCPLSVMIISFNSSSYCSVGLVLHTQLTDVFNTVCSKYFFFSCNTAWFLFINPVAFSFHAFFFVFLLIHISVQIHFNKTSDKETWAYDWFTFSSYHQKRHPAILGFLVTLVWHFQCRYNGPMTLW